MITLNPNIVSCYKNFVGYVAIAFIHALHVTEVSKCYSVNNENYCFYTSDTNDTMASWDEAREFCVRILYGKEFNAADHHRREH